MKISQIKSDFAKFTSSSYTIVAGCSRFGASIASIQSEKGAEVVVVDNDPEKFRNLSVGFSGFKILGDPTDIDILIKAGIEKASLVIAATNDDNANIMISQISSKIYSVPKVVARVYDSSKEIIYQGFSVKLIYPTQLSTDAFNQVLDEVKEDKKI